MTMKPTPNISDKRTQIYLPQQLHKQVKQYAKQRGVSMAAVIRQAIEWRVEEVSPEYRTNNNDLMKVSGILKEEPKDVSKNMSKYIEEMYQEKDD